MAVNSVGTGIVHAGNTIQRFQDKVKNNTSAAVTATAVAGTTGALIYGAGKVKPKYYGKVFNPIANGVRKAAAKVLAKVGNKNGFVSKALAKTATGAGKVANWLKANPKTAVVGALIASGAVGLLAVLNKRAYNDGRIDQKYEDRAAVQLMSLEA